MVENRKGADSKLLEVKVLLICLGTAGVSARRDGRYVYNFQPQPDDLVVALDKARLALLDALGCACETKASSLEAMKVVDALTAGVSLSPRFHLPATTRSLDPAKGTFALGVLIRFLDHNDALTGAEWGHPSGIIIIRSTLLILPFAY